LESHREFTMSQEFCYETSERYSRHDISVLSHHFHSSRTVQSTIDRLAKKISTSGDISSLIGILSSLQKLEEQEKERGFLYPKSIN